MQDPRLRPGRRPTAHQEAGRFLLERPEGRRLDDAFYSRVAEAYRQAAAMFLNPRQTLARDSVRRRDGRPLGRRGAPSWLPRTRPTREGDHMSAKRRIKTKAPGVFRSISGRYEIVYKDSSGKLRSEVIGDNFEEAKAARADRVATMARGGKIIRTRDTFGDYAERWIASLAGGLGRSTPTATRSTGTSSPASRTVALRTSPPTMLRGWLTRCAAPAIPSGRSAAPSRRSQAVSARPCVAV